MMKSSFVFSILVAYLMVTTCSSAASVENRAVDPFVPGQYPVNYTAFNQIINHFVDLNVDVYAPNAPGDFPVMYFITGFGGISINLIVILENRNRISNIAFQELCL